MIAPTPTPSPSPLKKSRKPHSSERRKSSLFRLQLLVKHIHYSRLIRALTNHETYGCINRVFISFCSGQKEVTVKTRWSLRLLKLFFFTFFYQGRWGDPHIKMTGCSRTFSKNILIGTRISHVGRESNFSPWLF